MNGSMLTNKIKVIVFDFDGTLYQDTHHFDFYARRLQAKLTFEKQDLFWGDYQLALQGKHTLRIGRLYDAERDIVLVQQNHTVQESYDWEGNRKSEAETKDLYSTPVTIDQIKIISVGDLWWLPAAIASHYGLSLKGSYEAFLETRSYMMGANFSMEKVPGFKEALLGLKKKGFNLALLTNSPETDSEVILSKLGFEHLFEMKVFEGQKPSLTQERFQEIKDYFQVEFCEMLSIGDNWINEILPATELGCSTILIDAYSVSEISHADRIVRDIIELIPLLDQIK